MPPEQELNQIYVDAFFFVFFLPCMIKNVLNPPFVGQNMCSSIFMALHVSGMISACCKSAAELQRGASQEIIYIWDYNLSDMAQTKVHKYKQGGLMVEKSVNLW